MKQNHKNITNFDTFSIEQRRLINTYLGKVLWIWALAGPAIAFGIFIGIFPEADYTTCITIFLSMLVLSIIHSRIYQLWPESKYTSLFTLFAMDLLLIYMTYSRLYIELTWFLIPILSLAFCDMKIYMVTVAMNYISMVVATWITAPYYANVREDYSSPMQYFFNVIGGYTIETMFMVFAGYVIGNMIIRYFKSMIENTKTISSNESNLRKQISILNSMSQIYNKVNLLDFGNNTETSLTDYEKVEKEFDFNRYDHSRMTAKMSEHVTPTSRQDFLDFTNLLTLRQRLTNKKSIYGEFIDEYSGWFRAQYITVEKDSDGVPIKIIFTTQNIDEDKKREEILLQNAMTDELTHLYNRRCYDKDMAKLSTTPLDHDFAIISIDINGLKPTNDTKGHTAGDELLIGAAECITSVVGKKGKTYRTGGDEFISIIEASNVTSVIEKIHNKASNWKGVYCDNLSLASGFASRQENPEATVTELEKIADTMMYHNKSIYYQQKGIDRRRLYTDYD